MKTFDVHEASFQYDESDPEGYRCGMDRFGPSTRIEPAVAVCPDSNKMGVWTGRKDEHVMVRLGTRLDYYDGEL